MAFLRVFKMAMTKRWLVVLPLLVVTVAAVLGMRGYQRAHGQTSTGELQTQVVRRGDLRLSVVADGQVYAQQSAILIWRTSGTVAEVNVQVGDTVRRGQVLARLAQTSLPPQVILAQNDLIEAQRTLENLQNSQTQRAQALRTLEEAQQALEDALNSELRRANALAALSQAQKAVEEAQRALEILEKPPSSEAIQQAYSSLLLAQNALEQTEENIARIERRLAVPESAYKFWESRRLYQRILESLKLKRVRDQRAYEEAAERYQRLLQPPDPSDLAVAQANLEKAKAQLAQAQREWERVKDGSSPAEIALLQAQLDDARRQWERWKDGPDPNELVAAQARLAAAQAVIDLAQLKAPFSATVTQVAIKPGDQVDAGTLAFRLDDLSRLVVKLQVSEIDNQRVQAGQAVVLSLDAVPGRDYHGRVIAVAPVGSVAEGVTSFEVQVEIIDADDQVRPGMSVTAEIQVAEIKDAVLVPLQAVRFKDGHRLVYVLRQGRPQAVEIVTGASSSAEVQVLAGEVQAGDVVLLNADEIGVEP